MTITPFTVYCVLQADAFKAAIITAFAIAAIAKAIHYIVVAVDINDTHFEDKEEEKERRQNAPRLGSPIALMFMMCLSIGLIPSTSTFAGSLIAPAIVNSSAIQKDIPELYTLGVEALKETFKPK